MGLCMRAIGGTICQMAKACFSTLTAMFLRASSQMGLLVGMGRSSIRTAKSIKGCLRMIRGREMGFYYCKMGHLTSENSRMIRFKGEER